MDWNRYSSQVQFSAKRRCVFTLGKLLAEKDSAGFVDSKENK